MAKEDRDFQHESLQDKQSIVSYLEAVAEGFRTGALRFSDERGEIVLQPEGLMNFELRAQRKRERVTLTMRCQWKQGESPKPSSGPLTIDGNAP